MDRVLSVPLVYGNHSAMKTMSTSLRRLALAGAVFLLLTAALHRAHAMFYLTLTQVGGNVVINGSGTVNLTALTFQQSANADPAVYPALGLLTAGAGDLPPYSEYDGGGLTGPAAFGNGTGSAENSGTGGIAGILGSNPSLLVPQGYVSGSPLTYSGGKATVSGIVPGTTVWFRVHTAGIRGVMGAWSDPAKIIVV